MPAPSSGTVSRATRLCILAIVILFGRDSAAQPPAAQAPPVATQPGAVDEATRKLINDLKLQVIDAKVANDPKKEFDLLKKILTLDPGDALATLRIAQLTEILRANEASARQQQVQQADEQARQTLARTHLATAEDGLVEAKRTGKSEPLVRARAALVEARKYARSGDQDVERLQRMIDDETSARRVRFWEWWGVIGVVALAAMVGLAFYVLRASRVLEMIDGPQTGQVFKLEKDATALGALASEVDWAIEDPLRKISRRHCELVRQGRHFFLVDCSMNGTFLNGRPLQKGQPALLKRGDRIGLGGAATLLFR